MPDAVLITAPTWKKWYSQAGRTNDKNSFRDVGLSGLEPHTPPQPGEQVPVHPKRSRWLSIRFVFEDNQQWPKRLALSLLGRSPSLRAISARTEREGKKTGRRQNV